MHALEVEKYFELLIEHFKFSLCFSVVTKMVE